MLLPDIKYDYSKTKAYIYKIDFGTSSCYIGSTINPRQRMTTHFKQLLSGFHKNVILQSAFNKYGERLFNFTIIGECNLCSQFAVETIFINSPNYNAKYNICREAYFTNANRYNSRSFTKDDIINIFNLANSGKLCTEIALPYNKSKSLINAILKKKVYCNESRDLLFDRALYNKKISETRSLNNIKRRINGVYVYLLDGTFIAKYDSIVEVCKEMNLNVNGVENAYARGIRYKEYLFFKNICNFSKYTPNKKKSIIYVFDEFFNQIIVTNNMSDCSMIYKINYNAINSNCNRLNINSTTNTYFVREKHLNKFKEKYNLCP